MNNNKYINNNSSFNTSFGFLDSPFKQEKIRRSSLPPKQEIINILAEDNKPVLKQNISSIDLNKRSIIHPPSLVEIEEDSLPEDFSNHETEPQSFIDLSAPLPTWKLKTLTNDELLVEYINSKNQQYQYTISQIIEQRTRYTLFNKELNRIIPSIINTKEYQVSAIAPYRSQLLITIKHQETVKQKISERTQSKCERSSEGHLEYFDLSNNQKISYYDYEDRFYKKYLNLSYIKSTTLLSGFECRVLESPETILEWYNNEKDTMKQKLLSQINVLMSEFNINVESLNTTLVHKMKQIGVNDTTLPTINLNNSNNVINEDKIKDTPVIDKENIENMAVK